VDFPEIVLIEARKCIACGMCAMVCPFDVITYYPSASAPEKNQVAIKCDNCISRQRNGDQPACVEACKVGALEFGELNEMIKAARGRYTQETLQTTGQQAIQEGVEPIPAPASIEAWRGWGAVVSHLNANGKKGA
jgi:carbon-monoxide dehydrogenase iron sulfur subunit